ncbi:MAG: helix-turn-helix domain-containing protein [Firmicutes bacterium]|nr:helix-turn-helix domain-containing protein [Bacillota bacterium]
MESRRFSIILRDAVCGDPDAVEAILSRYSPLIRKYSVVDEKFDDDLWQYIVLRVITQLPKFDLKKFL